MVFNGPVRQAATVFTARDEATDVYKALRRESRALQGEITQLALKNRRLIEAFLALGTTALVTGGTIAAVAATQAEAGQRFSEVQTILGATDEQLNQFRETARNLADELPVAVNSVSIAFEQLALSGFSASESLRVVDEVSQLLAATQQDAEDAAENIVEVFEEFSISADEADQVTGAFAATISESRTNVQKLTNALTESADAAERAGVSLQETSAAAGVLADAGIQGEEAGQALSAAFTSLQDPSGSTVTALNRLGVSLNNITDEEGNLRELSTVTEALRQGFSGVQNDSERARLAIQIAGEDGADALLALVNQQGRLNELLGGIFRSEVRESIGALSELDQRAIESKNQLGGIELSPNLSTQGFAEQLKQLAEQGRTTEQIAASLTNQLGISGRTAEELAEDATKASVSANDLTQAIGGAATASELQAQQTDTVIGAIDQLVATLSEVGNAIFQGLRDPLIGLIQGFETLFDLLGNNREALRLLGRALVPVFVVTSALAVAIGAFLTKILLITPALRAVSFLMARVSIQATSLLSGLRAVGAAFARVFFIVTLLLGVLMGIGEAFAIIGNLIESNFLGVGKDVEIIMNNIDAAISVLKPILDAIIDGFKLLFEIFTILVATPIVILFVALAKVLRPIVQILAFILAPLGKFLANNQALVDVLGVLIAVIITIVAVGGKLLSILSLIGVVVLKVGGLIAAAAALLNPVTAAILAIIAAVIILVGVFGDVESTIDAVVGAFQFLFAFLIGLGPLLVQVGKNIIDALVVGLLGSIAPLINAVGFVADIIASFFPFSNAERGPLSNIMSVGGNIINAIVSGLTGALSGLVNAVAAVADAIMGAFQSVISFFADIGQRLMDLLATGIRAAIGVVQSALKFIGDAIMSAVNSYINFVSGVGGAIIDAIVSGLTGGISIITDAMGSLVGAIADFLPFSNASRGPLSSIMSVGGNIVDAIAGGLQSGVDVVAGAAQAVVGAIKSALGGLTSAAANIGNSIAGGIASGLKAGAGLVGGAAKAVAGSAVDAAQGVTNAAKSAGSTVAGAVSEGVSDAASTAQDAGKAIASGISGALPGSNAEFGPLSDLMSVGPGLVESVASGITSNQREILGAATELAENIVEPIQDTPLGQIASNLAGDALTGLQNAVGLDRSGGGGQSGGQIRQTQSDGQQTGSDEINVTIDQTINVDGDANPEAVADAAARETEAAATDALRELERLLQQDMNK